MLTTLSDDCVFQQNPTNLIKTLASNPPKQIIEAINNSSRLLELFYFIYTSDEGCISHGSLKTLAQIARRRQRHRTHFVIEKKLKHLFIRLLSRMKVLLF